MQLGTNLIIGSSKTLRPAAHSEALIDFGGTARQGYSCSGERRRKSPIFNYLQVETGGLSMASGRRRRGQAAVAAKPGREKISPGFADLNIYWPRSRPYDFAYCGSFPIEFN